MATNGEWKVLVDILYWRAGQFHADRHVVGERIFRSFGPDAGDFSHPWRERSTRNLQWMARRFLTGRRGR